MFFSLFALHLNYTADRFFMSLIRKAFLLLALVLIFNTAWSQTSVKPTTANDLLGTWIGILKQTNENAGNKEPTTIVWRIHRINAKSKQVELTDMGQRFHDGAEIEKPLRKRYRSTYIDSVFVIAFHKNENKLTFTLKLRRNGEDGKLLLVGNVRADDKRDKQETSFHLVKVNDDISTYVKPEKGGIEVTTAPPQTTEH